MEVLRFLGKMGCCVAVWALLASADSIQLRDGRHLQGKYIGGTTTAIGFMTGGTLEYFATSDALVLIFDNTNDAPLRGLQPNPMKGKFPARPPEWRQCGRLTLLREITPSTPDGVRRMVRIDQCNQMRSWRKSLRSASLIRANADLQWNVLHKRSASFPTARTCNQGLGCTMCTMLFRTA